jgi:hypothetical protein
MNGPNSKVLHETLLRTLKPNAFALFMVVYYRVAFGTNPARLARMTIKDFVAETGLGRSAVCNHLKVLKTEDFLTYKNVGRTDLKGGTMWTTE